MIPVRLDGRSHYTIIPSAAGWTITVRRGRGLPEVLHADTRPEAARLTRRLAGDGLVGYVADPDPTPRLRYEQPRRGARP